jgi:hypothetical protein
MELQISMIPSPLDPPLRSDDYQSNIRNLGRTLKEYGLEVREVRAESGEWSVKLDGALGPVLGVPLGFWLQGRHGRAVRLTIGDVEADVLTADQLERAIHIARLYHEGSEKES